MFAARFVSDQVNSMRQLYIRNVLTSTRFSTLAKGAKGEARQGLSVVLACSLMNAGVSSYVFDSESAFAEDDEGANYGAGPASKSQIATCLNCWVLLI